MINAINLNHLRNPEFIQFCRNFTAIVNTGNPTTLSVKPQYDNLVAKLTELEDLFMTAKANPITADIETLDLRRDRSIIGITGLIKNFSYHYESATVEASRLLQTNLDLYGAGIAQENYISETATINNLINDWTTKAELQNAVSVLGISDWITELKTANDEFEMKFLDRNHDYGQASSDNMKSKRAEALTAYYDLRKRLDAHAEIAGTELYTTTVNDLNALIETFNVVLRARKPAKKDETSAPAQ